ncbi:hypothetical protein AYO44_00360 [Planctomycetaceae bacterium SCGC AG-212-F19]|nr:hypothetical protein AYO44_00360 [Planctomycetaceae bacterium SCGC AG-212-F19]
MHLHILRTLIRKEVLRHLANRGSIMLALVLVCMALLLSVFGKSNTQPGMQVAVERCFIDYWQDGPWIEHLRRTVPEDWRKDRKLVIRHQSDARRRFDGQIYYRPNEVAIQVRATPSAESPSRPSVWFWYPRGDAAALAPFEAWFWKETRIFGDAQLAATLEKTSPALRGAVPFLDLEERREVIPGGLDPRTGLASALVMFSLFFCCVYLLPCMTCEERERGVLLAQMLSPATAAEILVAKFFFYPIVGVALAALIAGIYRPAVLVMPFFWLALFVSAFGLLGIGLSIASLARTQREASMGAMCYLFVIALFVIIIQQNNIPLLPQILLEYHAPRMLHAALGGELYWFHWFNLLGAGIISIGWACLATYLFRTRGWQ